MIRVIAGTTRATASSATRATASIASSTTKYSLSDGEYHELSSLYVMPNFRNLGIGSQIVDELLKRFDDAAAPAATATATTTATTTTTTTTAVSVVSRKNQGGNNDCTNNNDACGVCLLTLKPTVPFYNKFGFHVVEKEEDIPSFLRFEMLAGRVISSFLGNEIVCMVRNK